MSMPVYSEFIWKLWGSSSSDVFAFGDSAVSGVVMHYDGEKWEELPYGGVAYDHIRDGWGIPGRYFFIRYNFFSEDDESIIIEYDGINWLENQTVVSGRINDIWGSSENDVFAVGHREVPGRYQSVIMHFDGVKWSEMENYFTIELRSVWGSSSTNVFAVGGNSILHYDGISWSAMEEGLPYSLWAVWGASENSVYACGNTLVYYNGIRWTEVSDQGCWDLWVSPHSEVFISAGEEPARYGDGKSWLSLCTISYEVKGQREGYYTVWGASVDDVFVGGSKGRPESASRGMILKSNFKDDLNCLCE